MRHAMSKPKMRLPNRRAAVGLVACAVALGAVILLRQPSEAPLSGGPAPQAAAVCNETSYAVTYRSTAKLGQVALGAAGSAQHLDLQASASLSLRCDAFALRFAEFTGTGLATVLPQAGDTIQGTRRGQELGFDPASPQLGRDVARDILAKAQLSTGTGAAWSAEELDVFGAYSVRYERSGREIRKVDFQAAATPSTRTEIDPSSSVRFLLDSEERIISVQAHLVTRAYAGSQLLAETTTDIALEHEAAATVALMPPTAPVQDDLGGGGREKALLEAMHETTLAGRSWEQLEAALQREDDEEQTELFLALRALFVLHPQEAQRAAGLLAAGSSDEASFRTTALALAKAGHPAAERVLVGAIEAHRDDAREQIFLISLAGLATEASADLETDLQRIARDSAVTDVRQSARLAVANISRSAQATRPERYSANLSAERATLAAASSFPEVVSTLHVLGNFGAPELSEIIAPQLASKDPMIRATALSTLRFVETQAAETILVEAMTKDEDGEVRRAAAQELTFRRLDTASLAAVRELARTAREERLASALLTVLHAHIAVDPTLRQDIERLARNHPAEPIRQQAAALLTTI